ncbi:hypothetical protein [Sphingorhabdus sp.]|uniref:hypothetical protein n=1 Tax=Sphingorhabdus sp. TaxID=1902408 RepID=UPI003982EC57
MNKIQKMVIGVLSVTTLIALAIPKKDPISEASTTAISEVAPPPANATPPPASPLPVPFNSEEPTDFQIGAPTIDGQPMQPDFGLPFGASPQTRSPDGDPAQNSQNGYTPPAYNMPGTAPKVEPSEEAAAPNTQVQ